MINFNSVSKFFTDTFSAASYSSEDKKYRAALDEAEEATNKLFSIEDNKMFFSELRKLENQSPEWMMLVKWHDFVAREIAKRTLLALSKK